MTRKDLAEAIRYALPDVPKARRDRLAALLHWLQDIEETAKGTP